MKAAEKRILLDEVESVLIQKDENVTAALVIVIAGSILFVLFLFVPKIYLSTHIYKTSVSLDKLQKEYASLKNENLILKDKIAVLKYNNGVTH